MTLEYEPLAPSRPNNAVALGITLAIGVALVLLAGNDMNPLRWLVVLSALGLSIVPFVNGAIAKLLDLIAHPTPQGRRLIAVGAGAMGALYLWVTATLQNRSFVPRMQDECSYIISTQLLAHGRLWMPMHPLADFFESFFVLVKPVYCSIYFPGTAMFFAPAVWLGWQMWIFPLILSGGIIAMLYLVITDLLDGVAGIVAVFWILALAPFRTFSVMVMSHLPMLFLGLVMIWAWLQWRRERRMGWALVIGIASGWAAITRPADAVAYALPIGVAMFACLYRHAAKQFAATAAAVVIGAAPFLVLQVVFNHGVTGHWLESPYTYSLQLDQPGSAFGFHHFDPSARSASQLLEKQDYYNWCKTMLEQHQFPRNIKRWFVRDNDSGGLHNAYFTIIADNTLPGRLLLLLLPAGILAIFAGPRSKRIVPAATLAAFCFVYFFNPFFLEHYPLVVCPAVMLIALSGARWLILGRWSRSLGVPVTMAILALSVTSLWEFKAMTGPKEGEAFTDGMLEAPSPILAVNSEIPAKISNAVVLFGPRRASFFEEPVYNVDVADIDKASVIRAHDLGPRDAEIIRYYAQRQPDRTFYICDARSVIIDVLGTAKELAAKLDRGEALKTLYYPPPQTPAR